MDTLYSNFVQDKCDTFKCLEERLQWWYYKFPIGDLLLHYSFTNVSKLLRQRNENIFNHYLNQAKIVEKVRQDTDTARTISVFAEKFGQDQYALYLYDRCVRRGCDLEQAEDELTEELIDISRYFEEELQKNGPKSLFYRLTYEPMDDDDPRPHYIRMVWEPYRRQRPTGYRLYELATNQLVNKVMPQLAQLQDRQERRRAAEWEKLQQWMMQVLQRQQTPKEERKQLVHFQQLRQDLQQLQAQQQAMEEQRRALHQPPVVVNDHPAPEPQRQPVLPQPQQDRQLAEQLALEELQYQFAGDDNRRQWGLQQYGRIERDIERNARQIREEQRRALHQPPVVGNDHPAQDVPQNGEPDNERAREGPFRG